MIKWIRIHVVKIYPLEGGGGGERKKKKEKASLTKKERRMNPLVFLAPHHVDLSLFLLLNGFLV